AIWIKPKLVAQINFTEWTGGNSLRHPSYQGLREDKPAKHVVREEKATEPEGSRADQIWARTTPRHPLRMNPIGYSSRVQEAGNLVSRSELTKTREKTMAKKAAKKRKYSRSSGSDVKSEMRRYKKGTAKSGRGGKGGKVKSRKQAIAIGLSKARKKGKKVPKKRATKRKT
ncbi:MAG TPA: DUF6496 domain-containing protein, partial [Bryobacteraceae bacterium]|nr:DUF6496 domain-containing protein [Bryobacteraceae bacterium]